MRPRNDDMVPTIGGVPVEFAGVYAVGPVDRMTPIKIGYAADPRHRLSGLQISHWKELQIFHCAWVVDLMLARRIEIACHKILDKAGKRLRGEWFSIDQDWAWKVMTFAGKEQGVPIYTTKQINALMKRKEDIEVNRLMKLADMTYDRAMAKRESAVDKNPLKRGIKSVP